MNISEKPERKYFSTEGAIQFLEDFASYKLSKSRFYVLTASGEIPSVSGPGGRLLIPIDALRQWVEGSNGTETSEGRVNYERKKKSPTVSSYGASK